MTDYVQKQVLENCLLFFGQEVKVITLDHMHKENEGPFSNYFDGKYHAYTAIVLPKCYSLKSIIKSDSSKILLESGPFRSNEGAISALLEIINKKLGQIFPLKSSCEECYIDKSAARSMCSIAIQDDIQLEPTESLLETSPTQATIGEEDRATETAVSATGNKRVEELVERKGRVWRVVGYTPSGEPCIEEHEPEITNGGGSHASSSQKQIITNSIKNHPSEYPVFGSRTVFTPGTSVVSDSGTITPSLGHEHSSVECTKKVEELNRALEDAKEEVERLERELLDAKGLCSDQEKQIEEYRLTTESLNDTVSSLKESIRIDQETRANEKQRVADFMKGFVNP